MGSAAYVNSTFVHTRVKNQDFALLAQVFVEFEEKDDAVRAQTNLAGRKFNGHVVLTCYFEEDEYAKRDFSRH